MNSLLFHCAASALALTMIPAKFAYIAASAKPGELALLIYRALAATKRRAP